MLSHVNSFGDVLEFGNGITVTGAELFDYEWNVETNANRFSRLGKKVFNRKVTFSLKGEEIRDRFHRHFDDDLANGVEGYFEFNGYRLYGYLVKSSKSKWVNGYLVISATYASDYPNWQKPVEYVMKASSEASGLTYPHTYPFTFGNNPNVIEFGNESTVPSDFIMTITGQIASPAVFINGHRYQVDIEIEEGWNLVIDSRKKTIVMQLPDGSKVNCFSSRNRESDVFRKIGIGSNSVSFGSVNGTLTVIEERSEPRWT